MKLIEYLLDLKRLIASRPDIRTLWWTDKFSRDETRLVLRARVEFQDDSFLEFGETIALERKTVGKLHYSYHYQRRENIILRYDNAPPIFPICPTFRITNTAAIRWKAASRPTWLTF